MRSPLRSTLSPTRSDRFDFRCDFHLPNLTKAADFKCGYLRDLDRRHIAKRRVGIKNSSLPCLYCRQHYGLGLKDCGFGVNQRSFACSISRSIADRMALQPQCLRSAIGFFRLTRLLAPHQCRIALWYRWPTVMTRPSPPTTA